MSFQAVEGVSSDDPSETEAMLESRARLLTEHARPPDEGRSIEALVCRLGGEEYAVELRLLHGVFRTVAMTRVPCAPPFVAGLMNFRGEILTVLDLAVALGLPPSEEHEVILVDTTRVRVGLQVEKVLDVRRVALEGLDRGLVGNLFTRGIALAKTVLLDLELLLADSRFEMPDDKP